MTDLAAWALFGKMVAAYPWEDGWPELIRIFRGSNLRSSWVQYNWKPLDELILTMADEYGVPVPDCSHARDYWAIEDPLLCVECTLELYSAVALEHRELYSPEVPDE